MIYTLTRTQQLFGDIDRIWEFFSSPRNLSGITPKDMAFVVLSDLPEGDIYEGLIIDYSVSPLLGIPLKWQTKIAQVDYKRSFTDIQQKGPYKLWRHRHEFLPNDQGVLMRDTVDYELPFGLIGTMAHGLIVKRKLENIFSYRYDVLENLFNQQKK